MKVCKLNSEVPSLFPTPSMRKPAASLYPADRKLEDPSLENVNHLIENTQTVTFGILSENWAPDCPAGKTTICVSNQYYSTLFFNRNEHKG